MQQKNRKTEEKLVRLKLLLGFMIALNVVFWCGSRDVYERWSGVPPVPTKSGAITMTLGDPEFSYRALAIALQNLGDVGRDVTPLKDYNYDELGKWFFLLFSLDPVSDHVPMTAAYYFGATKVPKDVSVIVRFLEVPGTIAVGEKWRWLVHAVYLAQHRMYDLDLALRLAYKLQHMPNVNEMPPFARQMPAFVLQKRGDKEAARELMENMILSQRVLSQTDINNAKYFLTQQLGIDPQEVDKVIRMRGKP